MHDKDHQSKIFFGQNQRFADLLNGTFYHGVKKLSAEDFVEQDTEINVSLDSQYINRKRDLIKKCCWNGVSYALFAVEFQSKEDKTMPVRIMEYDSMHYSSCLKKKEVLTPVVSLCLYTGESDWTSPTTLHEMMDIPEELKEWVQDYHIHVLHILHANIESYSDPEVREFFELYQDVHTLNRKQLEEKYTANPPKSPDAVETVAILGNCPVLKKFIKIDEEEQKMCRNFNEIVQEIMDEGKAEGIVIGKAEGIDIGKAEGINIGKAEGIDEGMMLEKLNTVQRLCEAKQPFDLICKATDLTQDQVLHLMKTHRIEASF